MSDQAKPRGFLEKYGARLIRNGYEIIPIRRGSKAPPFDGWSYVRADADELEMWLSGRFRERTKKGDLTGKIIQMPALAKAGVGILSRVTSAADLDIRDEKMALAMEDFVTTNFGFAPVRIGMAPKRLLLFRATAAFSKVQSQFWIDPFCEGEDGKPIKHKVEILGAGQQFVAYAIHPDTGKRYEWISKQSPVTTKAKDLPELSEDDAQQIVAEFERLAQEAGWEKVKGGNALSRRALSSSTAVGVVDHDDVFASDKARTDIDDAELRRKLLLVPGVDDYETWLQIGMALFHQYEGGPEGLELWHEWSCTSDAYKTEALDNRWETFDISEKGRTPVTARLIIKLAKEAEEQIAVETFREIQQELTSADSLDALRKVCDKVKHIEFDVFHRAQIVGLVQKRFKEIARSNLTISVARDMVRYEQPETREAPHWLEGFVYVGREKQFYSLKKHYGIDVEAFNASYNRFMLTKRDVLEGKAMPDVQASHFALNSIQIPVVQGTMYMPGEEDVFWVNSIPYVNTYTAANVPEIPEKLTRAEREAIATVEHHFSHLFEDAKGRRFLMDSMAFLVQNPGKRLNWGTMLQGTEKDGKTFFAGLLAACIGSENVVNLFSSSLEEKYTSWAEGCQVAFFEEIKLHGHNRYDVLNKVKPLLTNPFVSIRKMNTNVYQAINTVSYFLTTNFKDALPLDENDSRYFILFSRFQSQEDLHEFLKTDPTYYRRLYDSLNHAGALRKWLLGWEISADFDHMERAPESKAKKQMVAVNKSDEQNALSEILAESPRVDMTAQLLNSSALADLFADKGVDVPYGRSMSTLIMGFGFTRLGKVRVGKETHIFWSRKPHLFETDGVMDPDKVRSWLDDEL